MENELGHDYYVYSPLGHDQKTEILNTKRQGRAAAFRQLRAVIRSDESTVRLRLRFRSGPTKVRLVTHCKNDVSGVSTRPLC